MALLAYQALDSPEALPSCRCTINFQGRLLCKKELHRPATAAARSRWERVEGELRGTSLSFEFVPFRQRQGREQDSTPSRARSYTLQFADAGLAVDSKDHVNPFSEEGVNAFRLRVEGEQLLCVAPTAEKAAIWVEQVLAAVAISGPIDERAMAKYPCIPPRRPKASNACEEGISGRWLWMRWSSQARMQYDWLMGVSHGSRNEGLNQDIEIGKGRMPHHPATAPTKALEWWIIDAIVSDPDTGSRISNPSVAATQCPCSSCQTPESSKATRLSYQHGTKEPIMTLSSIELHILQSQRVQLERPHAHRRRRAAETVHHSL
ncbi:hypothetical protein BDY17DRAFT_66135 [Neohortaea acidophila]|uniref:PH domain-containing protein n=1 Tax=Neohortaea acidophila TaxID=245834 RepID=A0A6A6PFM7_9PEZI|nr:uncharacterized protein BDY17DRAFT_66135 [Neohortaea acidophila]KAF2478463.1 hypothetical protein BDY17DRAFT_66135 [Neohortaea acidophila]